MSILNKDILLIIFNELFHDYGYNSLFSCLLVNRYWCETVVPILWRNPWRYQMKRYQKRSLFITIISFLSNETREYLKNEITIKLPYSNYEIIYFDYLKYCRSIVNHNLYDIIYNNIIDNETKQISVSINDYCRYILQEEIYKLLIKKCPHLKYMDITFTQHQIDLLPGAKTWLSEISELRCSGDIEPQYFQGLAKFSRSIEKIIVDSSREDNYGLAKLIEVQKNLKYFKILREEEARNDTFSTISHGLIRHAKSLTVLKAAFKGILFIPNILPKLVNLQKLKLFVNDKKYEEQLKISTYSNLKVLHVKNISVNTLTNLIENTKGHLREIWVEEYKSCYDPEKLIRTIYEKCPYLEVLSIILYNHNFIEFEKLLHTCRYLKTLYIKILSVDNNEEEDTKILSEILKEVVPTCYNNITLHI